METAPPPQSATGAAANTRPAPWLTIVGCLPSGALAPTAPQDALAASAVFGAARLLHAAGVAPERQRPFRSPLAETVAAIVARAGAPTTVLASGDPLHHGIGATLLRALPPEAVAVHPAPSAFSLAAAAMRWPLETVACVSVHNAAPVAIRRHLAPGRRLLCLTRDGAAPQAIAHEMTAAGFGESALTVLGDLGTAGASIVRTRADQCCGPHPALNVLAIACVGRAPALVHDGCITRDAVRTLTVAALRPPGHLWDVGAGSGSVALAWLAAGGTATLFERSEHRLQNIAENLANRGFVAEVRAGDAGARLDGAGPCDAIFLGGAVADSPLFEALWARLPAGGRFVANAVTLEGTAALAGRHARLGGTLTHIALSHAEPLGAMTALKPALPVLQWCVVKA